MNSAASSAGPSPLARATQLYKSEPAGIRWFVRGRRLLAPLESVLRHVPAEGSVLDIGCGHGLVSLALALADPSRRILGVDPSKTKLDVALRAGRGFSNVEFRLGSAEAAGNEKFGVITILDVLLLLPYEQKVGFLSRCRELLAPGGRLLLKTNDTHPAWKFAVTRAQERIMNFTGLTFGPSGLHFLSCDDNNALLRKTGFNAEIHHLRHWSPYPHTLFVAKA